MTGVVALVVRVLDSVATALSTPIHASSHLSLTSSKQLAIVQRELDDMRL
jgi:hypothetical protein